MSNADLLKLSIEIRRKYQFHAITKWAKGLLTGRETIEEVISLENVIYIDDEIAKQYRDEHAKPESDPPKNTIN